MELRQARGKPGDKHGANQETNTGQTRRQTRGKPGDKHGANQETHGTNQEACLGVEEPQRVVMWVVWKQEDQISR